MMGMFIHKGRLSSDGEDKSWKHGALAVEFRKVYQSYHGHMGVAVVTIEEPREPTDFSGPGSPPEFVYSCQIGSFNLDANPTTTWHEEFDGRVLRRWFETVTPRSDLRKGETMVDRFIYESYGLPGSPWRKQGVITTEDAMTRMEKLAKDGFRDRWNQCVMRIRERKHRQRVEAREGMEERFVATVRKLDDRIALGTSVREEWEPEGW